MPDVLSLSYLKWLNDQDTVARLENSRRYEDYYDGDTAVRLPTKLKAALESQLGFTDNYCRRVVDIPVAFLAGADLGLEVTFGDDLAEAIEDEAQRKAALDAAEQRAKEAERYLYQVYKDNSMLRRGLIKALRIQGKKGEVAFKVGVDGDRDAEGKLVRNSNLQIRITALRPDIVFPRWSAEDYEEMESCVIKYPRVDASGRPEVFAQVWTKDEVIEYISAGNESNWRETRRDKNTWGVIPIVWCKNREDDLPWGRSDLEDIIPLQDAINKTLTDLMVNADYQAFQKVFLLGHDASADDQISLGPGTLTTLTNPETKVHTIEPASPDGLLAIFARCVEEVSALSGIPQRMFNKGEGFGQLSGVALKIAFMPLLDLTAEKAALMREALEWVNWLVFRIAAVERLAPDYTDLETSALLEAGLPTDIETLSTMLTKQVDSGLKSRETAMKELGIEDVDAERERIQQERDEAGDPFLAQALGSLQQQNAQPGNTAGAVGDAGQPAEDGETV